MVQRNVIVRQMNALESLGAVTNICSDKTGTITQGMFWHLPSSTRSNHALGKMVVKRAWIPAKGIFTVEDISQPFNPTVGTLSFENLSPIELETSDQSGKKSSVDISKHIAVPEVRSYLEVASLANLATVHQNEEGEWVVRGDPTEIGIQVFACRFKYGRETLKAGGESKGSGSTWTQLAEFPFDSDVKRMSVIFREQNEKRQIDYAFMKGAVERVLDACTLIRTKEGDVEITEEVKTNLLENMEALASEGLRVLAFASKPWLQDVENWRGFPREDVEKDMVLLGLIGLYDPPRVESLGTQVLPCSRRSRLPFLSRFCQKMSSSRNHCSYAYWRS